MVLVGVEITMFGVREALTTMVIELLITEFVGLAQGSLLMSTQANTSPLFTNTVVSVGVLLPTMEPFLIHWYVGLLPPFVMVVLNTAAAPVQMVRLCTERLIVGVHKGVA